MSYDLMVFAVDKAPREPAAFGAWYRAQAEWSEDHGYDDPAVSRSQAEAAFGAATELAARHGVGFYDVAMGCTHRAGWKPRRRQISPLALPGQGKGERRPWEADASAQRKWPISQTEPRGFPIDVSASPSRVFVPDGAGGLVELMAL